MGGVVDGCVFGDESLGRSPKFRRLLSAVFADGRIGVNSARRENPATLLAGSLRAGREPFEWDSLHRYPPIWWPMQHRRVETLASD